MQAFFTSSYLDDNPEDGELLNRLKSAILDQVSEPNTGSVLE